MARSVFNRPVPRLAPIVNRDALSVDDRIALFSDRRCRYGAAVEWLTTHELRRIELNRWEYQRGRLNEGERQ